MNGPDATTKQHRRGPNAVATEHAAQPDAIEPQDAAKPETAPRAGARVPAARAGGAGRLPVWLWSRPMMMRALAARDLATVYRTLGEYGYSQRVIGALAGQSPSQVSQIAAGRTTVTDDVLAQVADGLGIPLGYLAWPTTGQPTPAATARAVTARAVTVLAPVAGPGGGANGARPARAWRCGPGWRSARCGRCHG